MNFTFNSSGKIWNCSLTSSNLKEKAMRIKQRLSVPRSMPSLFRLGVLKLFKRVFEYLMTRSPPPTPPCAVLFSLVSDHVYEVNMAITTNVILPRRWSSYVIWFVLHIRVEAWVAQVISYSGIGEGNSNISCSVWIVGRNGRMGMKEW